MKLMLAARELDNILTFQAPSLELVKTKKRNTNSNLKSNGQPKATKADPIRDTADIEKVQEYFLDNGNFRNYMLVTLGIHFALRAGDLLSLRLKDVYEKGGKVKNSFFIHEEKTTKRRRVDINSLGKEILAYYWEEYAGHNMEEPLFPSRNYDKETGLKKPITIQRLNQILAEAQKTIGIEDHMSSHCLRKTHAYQIMKKAENKQEALYAMQHELNHSDAKITMIYCGIEDDIVKELNESTRSFTGNVKWKR